jgi:hypothetical protein
MFSQKRLSNQLQAGINGGPDYDQGLMPLLLYTMLYSTTLTWMTTVLIMATGVHAKSSNSPAPLQLKPGKKILLQLKRPSL